MKMLFATTNIRFHQGEISVNSRIPDAWVTETQRAEMISRGFALEMDPMEPVDAQKPAEISPPAKTWAFDFEELAPKTLDELNMMIQEVVRLKKIVPVEPFESREEAILFMTSEA